MMRIAVSVAAVLVGTMAYISIGIALASAS
jgi:hypothetical protein